MHHKCLSRSLLTCRTTARLSSRTRSQRSGSRVRPCRFALNPKKGPCPVTCLCFTLGCALLLPCDFTVSCTLMPFLPPSRPPPAVSLSVINDYLDPNVGLPSTPPPDSRSPLTFLLCLRESRPHAPPHRSHPPRAGHVQQARGLLGAREQGRP